MKSTTENSYTGSDGSGGKHPNPKITYFILILILVVLIYIVYLLSYKPSETIYYRVLPSSENSDTTASDGSGVKHPNPKFKMDTLIIYSDKSKQYDNPCNRNIVFDLLTLHDSTQGSPPIISK